VTALRSADRTTAAEIAAEIARSRARLSHDLAVLDRDYALRHLTVRAVRLAQRPNVEIGALGRTLHREAAPLALIGLGLGWLSLSGARGGGDSVRQLGGALAALLGLARECGFNAKAPEPTSPPLKASEPSP